MFGAPSKYGIMAKGDIAFVYGPFDTFAKAEWYGDSEFGAGQYRIVKQ